MTIISKRVFRPIPGKVGLTRERIRRLSAVIKRAGGGVRIADVVWGDGARDIYLYGVYESMEAGGKAATAMLDDPDFVALRAESENDPAWHWEGPEVWRTVFGAPRPDFPVTLQRDYQVDRRYLKDATALLPEVQALRTDRPVIAVVPVISGDMGRLVIGYYASSLVDLGEGIDRVGFSEAFQAIVVRATEFGSPAKSRVLSNI
jgi:hypothetical protein